MCDERSPRITGLSWGKIEVAGDLKFRDARLWPGGARAWDWRETGTRHAPGIQIADVRELVDRGAEIVVLSRGVQEALQVMPETIAWLEDAGIEVRVAQTDEAARIYNALARDRRVGGLFHSTC